MNEAKMKEAWALVDEGIALEEKFDGKDMTENKQAMVMRSIDRKLEKAVALEAEALSEDGMDVAA